LKANISKLTNNQQLTTYNIMVNRDAKLVENIFDKNYLEQCPTRDGFGNGLVEAGEKDERVVVLCADLAESTRAQWFQEKFPDRYIEIGVAEQNLATVASGLALYGKIPFIASYATFSPGRNNEQIRTTISLNNVPVKIVGAHAGVSVGPDGATHQALEDIALMRVQPNMTVLVPCDAEEARKATFAAAFTETPVYLRLARAKSPMFTTADTPFEIGKAEILWDSEKPQAAIIACGNLVHNALLAAHELADDGIDTVVLNNHTIKPMDTNAVSNAAKKAGAVVTVEEHQIAGGMGSAVAEILAQEHPVPIEFIGVRDQFGQSGEPNELIEHYGMGVESIKKAVKKVINKK
jgi:transketolase